MRKSRLESIKKKKENRLLEKDEAEEALISLFQDRKERLEKLQKKQARRRKIRKEVSLEESSEAAEELIQGKNDFTGDSTTEASEKENADFQLKKQAKLVPHCTLSVHGRKFLREKEESKTPLLGLSDFIRRKVGDKTYLSPEEKLAQLHRIKTKPFPVIESAYR